MEYTWTIAQCEHESCNWRDHRSALARVCR
jgi:hypothetical protein